MAMDEPTTSAAARQSATASQPPAAERSSEANVKETIESILVAFILAFIFRAFIVEAFVIPTGSMAPTLMGAHVRYRCSDCGYRYQLNYPTGGEGEDVMIPARAEQTFVTFCPNCGYRPPRRDPADPDNAAASPPVHYGDRILVLKYLYLLAEPQRWDVVVFKSPSEPERHDYTQNYIKRLVGKPGESVMILDGDIYISTTGQELGDFQVQTKPRKVQEALWRIVHDSDYYPRGRDRTLTDRFGQPLIRGGRVEADPPYQHPWKQPPDEQGWQIDPQAGVYIFDNIDSAAALYFDSDANPRKHAFTDWMAYNAGVNVHGADTYDSSGYTPVNNVSDVKLRFFYERHEGDGPLRLELEKHGHTFTAEITPTQASLYHRLSDAPGALVQSVPITVGRNRPMLIEFMNVDYQVTLRIDEQDVLQTTREQYQPDLRALLRAYELRQRLPEPRVRIIGRQQRAAVRHLSLWRDVYYTNRDNRGMSPMLWASPEAFPQRIFQLGADEFFVCGDNSPVSGDSRFWERGIALPQEDLFVGAGRVPRRFMLGKAFFVYWPAGFRPMPGLPPIIPNFGDMRFIH